jgi:hypothetical protein
VAGFFKSCYVTRTLFFSHIEYTNQRAHSPMPKHVGVDTDHKSCVCYDLDFVLLYLVRFWVDTVNVVKAVMNLLVPLNLGNLAS